LKKVLAYILAVAAAVFVVAGGIMGLKLLQHQYTVTVEAYTGLAAYLVFMVCLLARRLCERCPHCGALRHGSGKYCSHCGKEM